MNIPVGLSVECDSSAPEDGAELVISYYDDDCDDTETSELVMTVCCAVHAQQIAQLIAQCVDMGTDPDVMLQ